MESNVNLAQCMVTKSHIGYDSITNICSGAVAKIEWTVLDYAAFCFVGIAAIFVIALIISITYSIVTDKF